MRALTSTNRCSPEPSRECSNIFLTMASARFSCCTTLSRLSRRVFVSSAISLRVLSLRFPPLRASCNSSISSTDTPEKLLTKLSGFLISWAIPAVNWPSEASFCVWTSRSCAVLKSCQLARALLFSLEQTHVLDRDRRLIRVRGDQLDLFVSEWLHF